MAEDKTPDETGGFYDSLFRDQESSGSARSAVSPHRYQHQELTDETLFRRGRRHDGSGQQGSGQQGSAQQGAPLYGSGQPTSGHQASGHRGSGQYGSGEYGSPVDGSSQSGSGATPATGAPTHAADLGQPSGQSPATSSAAGGPGDDLFDTSYRPRRNDPDLDHHTMAMPSRASFSDDPFPVSPPATAARETTTGPAAPASGPGTTSSGAGQYAPPTPPSHHVPTSSTRPDVPADGSQTYRPPTTTQSPQAAASSAQYVPPAQSWSPAPTSWATSGQSHDAGDGQLPPSQHRAPVASEASNSSTTATAFGDPEATSDPGTTVTGAGASSAGLAAAATGAGGTTTPAAASYAAYLPPPSPFDPIHAPVRPATDARPSSDPAATQLHAAVPAERPMAPQDEWHRATPSWQQPDSAPSSGTGCAAADEGPSAAARSPYARPSAPSTAGAGVGAAAAAGVAAGTAASAAHPSSVAASLAAAPATLAGSSGGGHKPPAGTADLAADDHDPEHVDAGELHHKHRFTRSLGLTALSALIPGAGFVGSRLRWLGVAMIAAIAVVGGGLAWWVLGDQQNAVATVGTPAMLTKIAIALLAVALIWVAMIVGTHMITRPRVLSTAQRVVGGVVVGALSFAVTAPLAVASRYANVTASTIRSLTKDEKDTKSETRPSINTDNKNANDVWKDKARVNILLVGMDTSAVRSKNGVTADDINTDTMMVASIDTKTGNTVITQIPRNMARVPFPTDTALGKQLHERYPDGWIADGNPNTADSWANSIWAHVPAYNKDLFKNTDYPGADALKLGMQGALGLKIDYFIALDIDGLVGLIDAMGGVNLNVNVRIPVAGNSEGKKPTGWIDPGPNKKLNGYYAMWYARSRSDSDDFTRMGRQTCVVKAVIDQANPQVVLTKFEKIAKASENMLTTDIPQSMVGPFLELALRVKDGSQSRLLFTHGKNGFDTTDPNYSQMRQQVRKAIDAAGGVAKGAPPTTAPKSTGSSAPKPTAKKDPTSSAPTATGSADSPAESLTDACAYNPKP